MIFFLSRSRTLFYSKHRPAVAIAWSRSSTGQWDAMASCPMPDDDVDMDHPVSQWRSVSGRWENTRLEEIPK